MKDFLIIALAAYRLTTLLNKDEGPFEVFSRFRRWVGIRIETSEVGMIEEYPENEWAKMVYCPFCLSGYLVLFVLLTLKIFKPVYYWLGIWGAIDILLTFTNDRR